MDRPEEERSPLAGTIWGYPNTGFWVVHVIGVLLVGYLGYIFLR